jgi:folate-binding protein YgfZ
VSRTGSEPSAGAAYRAARQGLAHRIRDAAVLDIGGDDRVEFLQGQLTQQVRGLSVGEARETAALSPKGKLLFVARLVGLPDRIRLLLSLASRSTALDHLRKFAAFQKVTVSDRSEEVARIGLYGPRPAPPGALALSGLAEFAAEWLVPASDRAGICRRLEREGSVEVDVDTAEILRVEAGRPRFGLDIDGTNLPDEAGLATAISATKGCYVGQEIVARRRTYGRLNRRLVGFRFPDGPVPTGTPLSRPDSPEGAPEKAEAGRVGSSVVSPRWGPIGIGFAVHDVPVGGRLLSSLDPRRSANVSALPFA